MLQALHFKVLRKQCVTRFLNITLTCLTFMVKGVTMQAIREENGMV